MDSKFQMMHFTMNGLAIELNNLAIAELRDGSLHRSIQLITLACHLTSQQIHAHHTNVDQTYKFHWNDCAGCVIQKPLKLTQSTQAFLYLNFLTITPSSHYDTLDLCCPCGFAWAIWYK